MFDPYKIREDFPMISKKHTMQGHPLVFLDNSSTTFKPKCVLKAIKKYYEDETSNSHRGDYDLCYFVDKAIFDARVTLAKFINADENEIVFTSGDSMGLNLVAYGYGMTHLKEGDEILLSVAEHASNILPWFKVAELTKAKITYVDLNSDGKITLENIKKACTSRTKIISLAHVTNVLGNKVNAKEIAKFAHENDIIFVLDGAQSVPHMKIDVKDLDCDFLCFSGHKMCGPTGIGVLYGKYELLCETEPTLTGGGMNVKFEKDGEVKYLLPPQKFEAGTLNIEGIYGLKAAAEYLMNLGMENISNYEKVLHAYFLERMKEVPNIIIYNEKADAGIVTFNIKGTFAQDEATYLNSKGIALRSGQHCAKILHNFLHENATVRASIYFYTTKEEVDYLVDTLKSGGDFLDAYFA